MTSPDRRQMPRFEVWVPARVEVESASFKCRVFDISRRAGFVECERVWPVETELKLMIPLPGSGEQLELQGRVVRVGETVDIHGMGVVFTDVRAAAAAFIELILDVQAQGRGGRPGKASPGDTK